MAAIHQFLPGFTNGDAISNEAVLMRGIFRRWGYASDIFCEARRILPELRKQAHDAQRYVSACRPEDVLLLHLSIGSQVNDLFFSLPCRKAVLYHNVTPSEYFALINSETAACLALGRRQMARLAGAAQVNLADSRFNARELESLGYRNVRILPLLPDADRLNGPAARKTLRRFRDGRKNILFVGRCAPNKRIEDLLTAFFHYQKALEPESRLIHVGSVAGTERYYYLLLAQAKELGLRNVHFARSVPQEQLNAFYRCAHVFVSMSEHEGFCLPLIESLAHDVPVLAFAAAAVPETLDGSGVLFREKNFPAIAEMMDRLVREEAVRSAVIRGQRERYARWLRRDGAAELRDCLAPLLVDAN